MKVRRRLVNETDEAFAKRKTDQLEGETNAEYAARCGPDCLPTFEFEQAEINDEVTVARDFIKGHVEAVHSDGSVDIVLHDGAKLTSVQHLVNMKDPQMSGWFSRRVDFGKTTEKI